MTKWKTKAYAKVNMCLDVVGRMENGYHQVRMIMQTISLHDTLVLSKCREKGIFLTTDKAELGSAEDNLAYKAAKLLMEEFHIEQGIKIELAKQIPIAAGLAGGSADASAVLRGVNQLYELGLSQEALMERGVKLGADVPYCVLGGSYLAEGIGECLTPVPRMPECFMLIVKPPIHVSTKWVYENLHADELKEHPDVDGMLHAMEHGSFEAIAGKMGNVLERVTIGRYPEIQEIKILMKKLGALNAMMSGSGPTVFGIFQTREQMHNAYEKMKELDMVRDIFETTIVNEQER